GNSCQPNFKIIGKEDSQTVKIGVSVIQDSGGRSVTAKLGNLIKYRQYGLTRGCLVRGKKVSPRAAKANKHLKTLLQEKGGEWVKLQSEDIKPLLAILAVYDNRESYDLTEEQISEFIEQEKIAINNPLIREILSNPAGEEPENLIDEDLPISIPKSIDNIDDEILGNLDN
ncbi:MAG: ATP-binding protein, partial [Microcoleaceae cyanobacterium]